MNAPAELAPASIRFTQAHAAIHLTSSVPEAFAHATATLYAYGRDHGTAADWHIDTHLEPPVDLERFALAPQVEIGPGLRARAMPAPGGVQYWAADQHALIGIDRPARRIEARCADPVGALYFTARLVRQAMTARLLAAGAVYAHTAAATIAGRGVLISGHRHRGKTTTLVALLRHLPGDFVTNDRLLLLPTGAELTGLAWPSHMRAGIGTLLAYPDLADLVPEPLRALAPEQRWGVREKVSVEPADFPRLISSGTVTGSCAPAVMIWPDVQPGHAQVRVERVSAAEVTDTLLRTHLFMTHPGAGISSHINHWLLPQPQADQQQAALQRVAAQLADTVPCYRVSAGADTAALARAVAGLVPR